MPLRRSHGDQLERLNDLMAGSVSVLARNAPGRQGANGGTLTSSRSINIPNIEELNYPNRSNGETNEILKKESECFPRDEHLLDRVVQRHRDRMVVANSEGDESRVGILAKGNAATVPSFRLERYAKLLSSVSDITDIAQSIKNVNRVLDSKASVANCLHRYEMNQIKRRTLVEELNEEAVKAQHEAEVLSTESRLRGAEMETAECEVERAEYDVQLHTQDLNDSLHKLGGVGVGLGEMVVRARDVAALAAAIRAKRSVGTLTVLSIPPGADTGSQQDTGGASDTGPSETSLGHNLHLSQVASLEKKLVARTQALVDSLRLIDSLSTRFRHILKREAEGRRVTLEQLEKLKVYTKLLEEGDSFPALWPSRSNGTFGRTSDAATDLGEADVDERLHALLGSTLGILDQTKVEREATDACRACENDRTPNVTDSVRLERKRDANEDSFCFQRSSVGSMYSQIATPLPTSRQSSPLRTHPSTAMHLSGHDEGGGFTRGSSPHLLSRSQTPPSSSPSGHTVNLPRSNTTLSAVSSREKPTQLSRQQNQQAETLRVMRQELEYAEAELRFTRAELERLKQQCSAFERAAAAAQQDAKSARETAEIKIMSLSARLAELATESSELDAAKRLNAQLKFEVDSVRRMYEQLAKCVPNEGEKTAAEDPPSAKQTLLSIVYEQIALAAANGLRSVLSRLSSTQAILCSSPHMLLVSSQQQLEEGLQAEAVESQSKTAELVDTTKTLDVRHKGTNNIANRTRPNSGRQTVPSLRFFLTGYNRMFDAIVECARDAQVAVGSALSAPDGNRNLLTNTSLAGVRSLLETVATCARDMTAKAKPLYLSQPPTEFFCSAEHATDFSFSPFSTTLDGYLVSPFQEGVEQLSRGVSEMTRLNNARRRALQEGLSLEGLRTEPLASGAVTSESEASPQTSTAPDLTTPLLSDLAYFESLTLRMLRMTGRWSSATETTSSTEAFPSSSSSVVNHQMHHQNKANPDSSAGIRQGTADISHSGRRAPKKSLPDASKNSEVSTPPCVVTSSRDGDASAFVVHDCFLLSPIRCAVFSLAFASETLVKVIAMPLRRYEEALKATQRDVAASSPLNNVKISVSRLTGIKIGAKIDESDAGEAEVNISLSEALWRVIELSRELSVALRFRRIRKRIAERNIFNRRAANVLLNVTKARGAVAEAERGISEELPSIVRKSVRINENGNTLVTGGNKSLVPILKRGGGSGLTQSSTLDGEKRSRGVGVHVDRSLNSEKIGNTSPNRAELAARAVSCVETARLYVQSLLRAYQKAYPPVLTNTLRMPGGRAIGDTACGSGLLLGLSAESKNLRVDRAPVADTRSELRSGTAAWCLASLARDLSSTRESLESEKRLRLDPSAEIVHPLSSGAVADEDMYLIRLHNERLLLLGALAPFASKLHHWVSQLLAEHKKEDDGNRQESGVPNDGIDWGTIIERCFEPSWSFLSEIVPKVSRNEKTAGGRGVTEGQLIFTEILSDSTKNKSPCTGQGAGSVEFVPSAPDFTKEAAATMTALAPNEGGDGWPDNHTGPSNQEGTAGSASENCEMRNVLFGSREYNVTPAKLEKEEDHLTHEVREVFRKGIARYTTALRRQLGLGRSLTSKFAPIFDGGEGSHRGHAPTTAFPSGSRLPASIDVVITEEAEHAAKAYVEYFGSGAQIESPSVPSSFGPWLGARSCDNRETRGGIVSLSAQSANGHEADDDGGTEKETSDALLSTLPPDEALRKANAIIESWFQIDERSSSLSKQDSTVKFGGQAGVDGIDGQSEVVEALPKAIPTSEAGLSQRVQYLEDQLKTTKTKMSEYLSELFTQKSFLPLSSRTRGTGGRVQTVRVLITEPSRFNLTRELPLPKQIVGGALRTGTLGTAIENVPSLPLSSTDPNSSTLLSTSGVTKIRPMPHVLSTPKRQTRDSRQEIRYDNDRRILITPTRTKTTPSATDHDEELTSSDMFSPLHGTPISAETRRSTQGSARIGQSGRPSTGDAVKNGTTSRPLSGAAVGLRQHLSSYRRKQNAPVKDKSVGCDFGADMTTVATLSTSADANQSRRLSDVSLVSSKEGRGALKPTDIM